MRSSLVPIAGHHYTYNFVHNLVNILFFAQ